MTSRRASRSEAGSSTAALAALVERLLPERLRTAFTHTSWAEQRSESYERLELLGDSVLSLAVARELYERFPTYSEGALAKIRSHVVSRQSCALVGRELALDSLLIEHAPGVDRAEAERLAENHNVVSALVEALLGALYLELGFEAIRQPIVAAFESQIAYALTSHVDYKTDLQEELARRGLQVRYVVLAIEGPPHERRFTCAALVDGVQLGTGVGQAKKAAEQLAAKQALEQLADS